MSIAETELVGSSDEIVYTEAPASNRIVVTENVSDFSMIAAQRFVDDDPCVTVVLIRKTNHPHGAALAHHY